MNQGQEGVVLVMALAFLMVMTMLAVSAMDASQLEVRAAHQGFELSKVFEQAEKSVLLGAKQLDGAEDSECLQAEVSPNHFFNHWEAWWKIGKTCQFNSKGISSYYVMESLGEPVCFIEKDSEEVHTGDLYRISGHSENSASGARADVQIIYLLPLEKKMTCEEPLKTLSLGVQSWRLLEV